MAAVGPWQAARCGVSPEPAQCGQDRSPAQLFIIKVAEGALGSAPLTAGPSRLTLRIHQADHQAGVAVHHRLHPLHLYSQTTFLSSMMRPPHVLEPLDRVA